VEASATLEDHSISEGFKCDALLDLHSQFRELPVDDEPDRLRAIPK
jgi:hypothetical protein